MTPANLNTPRQYVHDGIVLGEEPTPAILAWRAQFDPLGGVVLAMRPERRTVAEELATMKGLMK